MTTQEQVVAKIGVDSSSVDRDMETFKSKVGGALEHAHRGFVHAGSAARAFHKSLESINEAVPGLGTAFQIALSPLTGLMVAATAGFSFVTRQIEKFNSDMSEIADMMSAKFGSVKAAVRAAADEIQDAMRHNRDFNEGLNDGSQQFLAHSRDKIDAMKREQDVAEKRLENEKQMQMFGKSEADRLKIEAEYQDKITKSRIASDERIMRSLERTRSNAKEGLDVKSAELHALQAYSTGPEQQRMLADIHKRGDLIKKMEADQEKADALIGKFQERIATRGFMGDVEEGASALMGLPISEATLGNLREFSDKNKRGIEKQKAELEPLTQAVKNFRQELARSEKEVTKTKSTYESVNEAYLGAKRKLDEDKANPPKITAPSAAELNRSQASIAQLASGWFWQPGGSNGLQVFPGHWATSPFAQSAREIERLRAESFNANALGNFSLRDADNARISALKSQLGGTGALKSEEYLDDIKSDISKALALAQGPGLNVNASNAP